MRFKSTINNIRLAEWDLSATQAILFDYLFSGNFSQVSDKPQLKSLLRSNILYELPMYFREVDTVYRTLKALHKKGLIQLYLNAGGIYEDWFTITEKGQKWGHYE